MVNGVTFYDSRAGIVLSPQERKTALLFQSYQLFPHMTVEDNVCAGMPRTGRAYPSHGSELDFHRARARQFLDIFGMADFADRYPSQLSGGQQQRVAWRVCSPPAPGSSCSTSPFPRSIPI